MLRLYVAGDAPNSTAARHHLRSILARPGAPAVELEIVDVLADPRRGLRDGILVTPTLIRVAPGPERRIVGNLRNTAVLLATLGLEGDDHA
jgi:circadian clock protein KaiB